MFIRGSRRFIIILTRGLGLYEILSEYFRRIICNQICIMGIYVKITLWICFLVIWSFSHKTEFVKTYFSPSFLTVRNQTLPVLIVLNLNPFNDE